MASTSKTNRTKGRWTAEFQPPQFAPLDDERREQIVQLLIELLEHSLDEPTAGIGEGADEGEAV